MQSIARHRRPSRGVTLVEILVVVAIMSLIAGAVGIGALRYWRQAEVKTAEINARSLRGAVKIWWVTAGSIECPTVSQLRADRALDADTPTTDPWGGAWRIECTDDEASVSSDGPDRTPGTEDDVRAPPLGGRGAAAGPEESS
jgi:general secretion pathway protein G